VNGRALVAATAAAALVAAAPARRLGPFEKNHPLVEAGNQAYAEGRYEDALAAFDAARRELPGSAAADFNLGSALYKLGRYAEAKQAFQRAAGAPDGTLRQKDHYNLGNALAQLGDDEAAIRAYRRALTLDPNDDEARHNLEVLLRKKKPPQQAPDAGADGGADAGSDGGAGDGGVGRDGGEDGGTDGGGRDGGAQDGGPADGGARDGGADGGPGDGGSRDGGARDGGTHDGGRPERADAGAPDAGRSDGGKPEDDPPPGTSRDAGTSAESGSRQGTDAGSAEELTRQDAEKLLESMKRNEKNLQLWRFQQRKKQRKADEKDW
jgi:tetratricopeptide (TPR) repeat protein